MDSRRMTVVERLQTGDVSPHYSHTTRLVSDLEQSQVADEVPLGPTILPIGTIIGTAAASSVILFLILALIIWYRLRSRHKRKNKPRDSLSDDNEEDVIDALRSTRPPEIDLGPQRKFPPTQSAKESGLKDRNIGAKLAELPSSHQSMVPPSYGFQVMGLTDSWPLVGWVPTSGPPLPVDGFPANYQENSYPRTLCFPLSQSPGNVLAWPQRVRSRTFTAAEGRDDRLTRSVHSANSSISSLERISSTRRSTSDNQLTSILRSTSQRLKEAQMRPLSRTMSALSQVPGAPPAWKPPFPRRDERGESREALIELDDASYVESVRSSVLDLKSNTPSQMKDSSLRTKSPGIRREISLGPETSEPDSLCQSTTPHSFIPVALTSPSRCKARANHDYHNQDSPISQCPPKIYEDDLAIDEGDLIMPERKFSKRVSGDDPFISNSTSTNGNSQSLVTKALDSENKQEVVFKKRPAFASPESLLNPLSPVTGNQQSPNVTKSPSADIPARKQVSLFQWSRQATKPPVISPKSKAGGIERKGHRRQKTICLSHLPRPVSVSVVLEEPESETTPITSKQTSGRPELQLNTTPKMISASLFDQDNKMLSSPGILSESRRTSDASYSATMSFYDYYTSPEEPRFSQTSARELAPSPTLSMKRLGRRAHNFSIDLSRNGDLARRSFTRLPSQIDGISLPQIDDLISISRSAPAQTVELDLPRFLASSPASVAPFHGPRPQPVPAPIGSIAASVSMLRRMNSEVSTYSNASNYSKGSPTIPALRGGGLSPAKSRSSGTRKYLSIGLSTTGPHKKRSRLHDSMLVHHRRAYNQSSLNMNHKNIENALGLVMPVIEHATPGLTPLKSHTKSSSPLLSPRKRGTTLVEPKGSTLIADEKCQACDKPLLSLRFDSPTDELASHLHEGCFVCMTCKQPIEQAYNIDRMLYYKDYYLQKLNNLFGGDVNDYGHTPKPVDETNINILSRRSVAMGSPLMQDVCHKSQMKIPSPKRLPPQKSPSWRASLGLYDEMGFLRSSPNRSPETSPKAKRNAAEGTSNDADNEFGDMQSKVDVF